jgi:GR25 family glycosyltransferase involved in LPS biosynthesis
MKLLRSQKRSKKCTTKSTKKTKKMENNISTYVINCNKHVERLEKFKKSAQRAQLKFKRESCVNGRKISKPMLFDLVKKGLVSKSSTINIIELSICMSHYNCWINFLNSCSKYALILEDDSKLHKNFKKYVIDILEKLENNSIKFGLLVIHPGNWMRTKSSQKKVLKINNIQINKETLNHNPSGTAYILSRSYAKYLVDNMFPIKYPVDIYLGSHAKKFNHLTIEPVKDPKDPECWTGPLIEVPCGGEQGTTQDYTLPEIKNLIK